MENGQQQPLVDHQLQPLARVDHEGYTELLYGEGCDTPWMFWDEWNAAGRCEAHLAHCIDTFSFRMDGIPRRTLSTNTNYPTSTASERATPSVEPLPTTPPPSPGTPFPTPDYETVQGWRRRALWDHLRTTNDPAFAGQPDEAFPLATTLLMRAGSWTGS